ncbi:hypothetical protein DMA11_08240 [Marinilabiliaceae bacterium JC017]|nr:hypothetical protein DMA11_08240 [Marinilabiliaceae bacterium JC017]
MRLCGKNVVGNDVNVFLSALLNNQCFLGDKILVDENYFSESYAVPFILIHPLFQTDLPLYSYVRPKLAIAKYLTWQYPYLIKQSKFRLPGQKVGINRFWQSVNYPYKNYCQRNNMDFVEMNNHGVKWDDYLINPFALLLAMLREKRSQNVVIDWVSQCDKINGNFNLTPVYAYEVGFNGLELHHNLVIQNGNMQCFLLAEENLDFSGIYMSKKKCRWGVGQKYIFDLPLIGRVEGQIKKVMQVECAPFRFMYKGKEMQNQKENFGFLNKSGFHDGYNLREGKIHEVGKEKLSLFNRWIKNCFQLESLANDELIDFIDLRFDEVKLTGITSQHYHLLFSWFGEGIEKIGNDAFDFYIQSRETNSSWRKALQNHLLEYGMARSTVEAIIERHFEFLKGDG